MKKREKPRMKARAPKTPYKIIVRKDGEWWMAYAPRLVGAVSQGRTAAEARRNCESAIRDMLEIYRGRGQKPVHRSLGKSGK